MTIWLRTNRRHDDWEDVLRQWAERAARRRGRSVHGYGSVGDDDHVWAKVYIEDPRPALRAMIAIETARLASSD